MKLQKDTHLRDWINANPTVLRWFQKVSDGATTTAKVYASYLYTYWNEHLSKRLPSIDAWVEEVKSQHRIDDLETKRSWGSELQRYYMGQKLKRNSRRLIIASVRSFFSDKVELSKHKFKLATNEEATAEAEESEEATPLLKDEVRTLIERCSPLYKAVFLTQLNGAMGVKELVYFNERAWKLADKIRQKQIPLKVTGLIRTKMINRGGQPYWGLLWDDCVDALANYLRERETKLGRPLARNEPLFVNQHGAGLTEDDIQWQMRRLRNKTGLEVNKPGERGRRFHPHELRDTFKTWCQNRHINDTISEFLMGHEIDPNQYNKFARTSDGERAIIDEMEAVRQDLNVLTGRGTKPELVTAQAKKLDDLEVKYVEMRHQMVEAIPRLLEAASRGVLLPIPEYFTEAEREQIRKAKQKVLPHQPDLDDKTTGVQTGTS